MQQKGFTAIIIVVVIILLFVGVSAIRNRNTGEESSAEDSAPVTSDIIIVPAKMPASISFEVPPGFTETSSRTYEKYYVLNDASVIITGEELMIGGTKLEDYAEDVKAQYEKTADEYMLLSDEEIRLKGDLPCRVLEFTYAIVGSDAKQDMECVTALLIRDDFVYIVTCKSRKETFYNYRALFLQMIESIEITSASPAESAAEPVSP